MREKALALRKIATILQRCSLWREPKVAQAAQLISEASWAMWPHEFTEDEHADWLPTLEEMSNL